MRTSSLVDLLNARFGIYSIVSCCIHPRDKCETTESVPIVDKVVHRKVQ